MAPRLLIPALLAVQTVAACDCESMLARRRREGAPTTSEARPWDEPAPAPVRTAPTARPSPPPVRPQPSVRPEPPVASARPKAPEKRVEKPLADGVQPIAPVRPGRGAFDRLRPVKLPRNVMPAQRIGAGQVQEQAAEPYELLDR